MFSSDITIEDDLFLDSDAAVIHLGEDGDVTLTHVADTGILLNSTMQLQFNDASQYINAPSATVLDINATDEVELNATLVDINANLEVSGTAAITGIATFTDDIIIGDGKTIGSASDVDAMTIASNGQVTFTQTLIGTALDISGDIDVDGTTNLDVVDIDGAVDMASTLQVDGAITSSTGATITTADNTDTLTLTSTDADANSGPNLRLYRNSGSPAAGDNLGQIDFEGRNDNSQDVVYASMRAKARDETDGTEDGGIQLDVMKDGSLTGLWKYYSDGTTSEFAINDDSIDMDFRVETNGVTDALFVDGGNNNVQIGTGADFVTNTAGTSNVRVGVNAGNSIESGGNYNVVVGDEAGTAITTGDSNVAVGYLAGTAINTGEKNSLIGEKAGDALTTGSSNVAVGRTALSTDTLGSCSIAIGRNALIVQNFTTATDSFNTAVGDRAGAGITTGVTNTL